MRPQHEVGRGRRWLEDRLRWEPLRPLQLCIAIVHCHTERCNLWSQQGAFDTRDRYWLCICLSEQELVQVLRLLQERRCMRPQRRVCSGRRWLEDGLRWESL